MAVFRIETKGTIGMSWSDGGLVSALNRSAIGARPAATAGMRKAGAALAQQMRENLRRHDKGGGRLEASIDWRLDGRRGQQRLEVGPGIDDESVLGYAFVIEEGRRPGAPPPPRGALLPWLQRVGLPPAAEYPIRMKIAREGLHGQPFPYIDPAADQEADLLDDIAGDTLDAVWQGVTL